MQPANRRLFFLVMLACAFASPRPAFCQSMIFPQVAQGNGYQTTFALSNTSAITATVQTDILSDVGLEIQSFSTSLNAYAAAAVTPSFPSAMTGWARVKVTPATAQILVIETLRYFDDSGLLLFEVNSGPSPADTTIRVPLDDENGYATSVALVNAGSQMQTVDFTLRGIDGFAWTTVPVSLPTGHQSAKFLRELLPSVEGFKGTLEVSSTLPVSVLILRGSPSGTFSAVPLAGATPQSYFSPDGGISAKIVSEIGAASSSVDVAIYSFTRSEIAQALITAGSRGVAVRVIADRSESDEPGSQLARIQAAGIPVKIVDGTGGGIMHNKYAILDGRLLITGSYNWTTAAEADNNENAIFLRDIFAVAAYQANFNALWSQ